MSALLNTGSVGIGEKTIEETMEVWGTLGLLDGVENEYSKIKTALLCEKVAGILINMNNYYTYSGRIDVVVFPIIRRVISKIEEYSKNAEGMIYLLEGEYILKRTSDILEDAIGIFNKHFSNSNFDVDAAAVAWVSDMIAQEYVASFSGKDIVSIGDGKFDAIVKLD